MRDRDALNTYFQDKHFDGVVHLAAKNRVVDAEKDKTNCIAVNLFGTKYLVDVLERSKDTWLIFGSSREVYGEQKQFPVKESAPKEPVNIYGECKLQGEQLIKERLQKYAITNPRQTPL